MTANRVDLKKNCRIPLTRGLLKRLLNMVNQAVHPPGSRLLVVHPPQKKSTMIKTFLPLAIAGLSLGTASVANAAITVTNTSANILQDSLNNQSVTYTFTGWSLGGGNALVVYLSGENTLGVTAKYGTEDLTIVQSTGAGNDHVATIGYIINPSVSTANLDVTWAAQGNSENMITALSLGGVGSVAASNTTNGNLSFNYTTTLDGGFVVGNATNNSFNFSSPPTVSSSNLDTNVFYSNISGNSSSQQIYGVIDTAGTYTDTYSNSVVSSGVAFEAAAIPEPSSALLGGLGALLLLCRRRN